MVLKLDPRLPLVWRNPHSLQLGVDEPPVTLHDLSNAQERMIAALVAGVSPAGLGMIGQAAGVRDEEIESLLSVVTPGLEPQPRSLHSPGPVSISGTGPTAVRLAEALRGSGVPLAGDDEKPTLAVIVAHYVIEPELHGYWLRRDVPHLPIVFGDAIVRVGPLVEPGIGPCLYCLARWRTDADAAWPTIASQLWGTTSPAESSIVASEVAALAARTVLARRSIGPAASAVSIDLAVATGDTTERRWMPHPDCGCIAVAADLVARAGENDRALGSPLSSAR